MNTFSEDSFSINPAGMSFVNVKEHLNELFNQHTIKLFTEYSDALSNLVTKGFDSLTRLGHLNPLLHAKSEVLDCNLRMVESYMPEILFVLSSKRNFSIDKSIRHFAASGFPFVDSKQSKIYLEHKIVKFFEALLFANLFNGVWNGEVISHKLYVYKNGDELEFYNFYNLRSFILKIIPKIALSQTRLFSSAPYNYELKFKLS